jgi:uncharacterized membrane protein
MKRMKQMTLSISVITLLFVLAPEADACVACFGKTDGKMAEGMNAGIFSLLAVIGSVLFGFAAFMVFIIRRNGKYAHVMIQEVERIRLLNQATA